MDVEMTALIVESGDSVSDYLVGQLADRLANQFIRSCKLDAGKAAGYAQSSVGIDIEDNAALDLALHHDPSGDTFTAISFLLHGQLVEGRIALQHFRQHGISSVDVRLDQLHFHR